jgi:hypothetical protein
MSGRAGARAYVPVLRATMADGTARAEDFGFAFWLAPLANAYVAAGDDAGAEALYREALAYFETLPSAAKLNVSANLALFLQIRGRNAEALELIDQSIAGMQQMGGVDAALLQMHAVRALALAGSAARPKPGGRSSFCDRTRPPCPTCTCARCSASAGTRRRATCWSSDCAVRSREARCCSCSRRTRCFVRASRCPKS